MFYDVSSSRPPQALLASIQKVLNRHLGTSKSRASITLGLRAISGPAAKRVLHLFIANHQKRSYKSNTVAQLSDVRWAFEYGKSFPGKRALGLGSEALNPCFELLNELATAYGEYQNKMSPNVNWPWPKCYLREDARGQTARCILAVLLTAFVVVYMVAICVFGMTVDTDVGCVMISVLAAVIVTWCVCFAISGMGSCIDKIRGMVLTILEPDTAVINGRALKASLIRELENVNVPQLAQEVCCVLQTCQVRPTNVTAVVNTRKGIVEYESSKRIIGHIVYLIHNPCTHELNQSTVWDFVYVFFQTIFKLMAVYPTAVLPMTWFLMFLVQQEPEEGGAAMGWEWLETHWPNQCRHLKVATVMGTVAVFCVPSLAYICKDAMRKRYCASAENILKRTSIV